LSTNLTNLEKACLYANSVITNKITACTFVKQACQRFLDDLNNPNYYFNENEVNTVISFINQLNLTEQKNPTKFILQDWQTFIVANLYGLYNKENDLRKYRSAYIELSRKQGKSQLITALSLYHLLFDQDSQIIISANSREQAKNVDFKKVKQFANQLDNKEKYIKQYFNKITFQNNEIIVTSSDAKRLDGLNASFVLIDEFHEAQDNKVYNVLKSSQGSRSEPLFMVITTAGFNIDSFCYQLRTYCTEILDKSKQDETQFSIIYTLDKDDQFDNPNVWIKSNPNLNISMNSTFLEAEVNKAKNNQAEKIGVLVKNFNVWQKSNSIENWIDEKYIKNAFQNISISNQIFKDLECFVGVDLASVSDIAAVSYMFQLDEKIYFLNDYYLCEDSKNSNVNRDLYKAAANNNEINITEGNVIDYNYILNDLLEKNKTNPFIQLSYDKWNSTAFAIAATESGLFLEPFSQTPGSLNKPVKEFERLIKSGRLVIQNNSLTKWMLNNVIIKINHMGNYSIDKSNRNKKIDGIAAMLNALGAYLNNPRSLVNVW
jgi:phage terminase large subunit-like protein